MNCFDEFDEKLRKSKVTSSTKSSAKYLFFKAMVIYDYLVDRLEFNMALFSNSMVKKKQPWSNKPTTDNTSHVIIFFSVSFSSPVTHSTLFSCLFIKFLQVVPNKLTVSYNLIHDKVWNRLVCRFFSLYVFEIRSYLPNSLSVYVLSLWLTFFTPGTHSRRQ